MHGTSHPNHGKLERLLGLVLLISTIGAYWYLLRCDFVFFDDPSYVTENPQVRMGLNRGSLTWAFTTFHSSNWHPLTWLSHMLDCDLYGLNPAGHHLTNLLFHVGNTLLLFLFLREATGANWRSFFVAALFSLHPMHVESVAWVSERKDVLSTFFWMLTLLAYVGYARQPGIWRYAGVFFFFALGLLAKPMLVTLPFVLLLLDYWPLERTNPGSPLVGGRQRGEWSRLFLEKAPLFLLSMASSALTYLAQSEGGAVVSLDGLSFGVRMANGLVAYVLYLINMLWPTNLSAFYPHPGVSLKPWLVMVSAVILIGLSGTAMQQASRRPYLLVGWLWYLGTLVPVIGLIQVGDQAMADRYTYIPFIGLFIAMVWGLTAVFESCKVRRIFVVCLVCTVFLALIAGTHLQLRQWKTTTSLFEHSIRVTKNNYLAHFILSQVKEVNGDPNGARFHYNKAVEINAAFVAKMHNRTGYYLAEQGQLDVAMSEFEKATQIFPDYANAHNNLGVVLAKKGLYEKALAHLGEALRISPGEAKVLESVRNVERDRSQAVGSQMKDPEALQANREPSNSR
jgi:protein O-mannosyl-transferase